MFYIHRTHQPVFIDSRVDKMEEDTSYIHFMDFLDECQGVVPVMYKGYVHVYILNVYVIVLQQMGLLRHVMAAKYP